MLTRRAPSPNRLGRAARFLALAGALNLPAPAAGQTQDPTRTGAAAFPVRVVDDQLRAAVIDATSRSATLERIVERLRGFKAVVYVQWTAALPRQVEAATVPQVTVTAGVRYLRIGLKPAKVSDYLVSVVAHELQHAIEILEAGVSDPAAVEELYTRLTGGIVKREYETAAAVETGRAVQRELKEARRSLAK